MGKWALKGLEIGKIRPKRLVFACFWVFLGLLGKVNLRAGIRSRKRSKNTFSLGE
jgi:hypothetical protein